MSAPRTSATDVVPQLWDINKLATYLDVPVSTIRYWRKTGYGPQPVRNGKVGKMLRWDPATVMAWLADNEAAA